VYRRYARLLAVTAALPCLPRCADARSLRALLGERQSNITLRKRLHVNALITEPGTVEIDWSGLYSFSDTEFTMPSAIRYTPEGRTVWWGRTEYSLAFDTLSNVDYAGGRLTQFSRTVSVAATTVLHDGERLDIAIAPQATFFLRDYSGARIGATAIIRYDAGRNSAGGALSWSGATHSADGNPAGILAAGFGFGRRLATQGLLGKFTPHTNLVTEKSAGTGNIVSVFEGVEYQLTPRFAIDVSGQHIGVAGGIPNHQIAAGITLNLGKWTHK